MSTRIKVEMKPVNRIVAHLGVGKDGDVQRFVTSEINKRITRYMPFRSGALSTKLKFMVSPTQIQVIAPYARYQYYGRVMVNAKTGKGPMNIPGVGLRYRTGTVLKATEQPLTYDRTKNPNAGPYWDRRMMAAEQKQIAASVQDYVDRKAGK